MRADQWRMLRLCPGHGLICALSTAASYDAGIIALGGKTEMVFPRVWLLVGALAAAITTNGWGSPTLIGCPVFPSTNVWNTAIDTLPVDPNSNAYVATIGAAKAVHPDFGTVYNGAPNGIPFVAVGGSQAKVPGSFSYAGESDSGPYPIPPEVPIEGGTQASGDRHWLVLGCTAGKLYALFASYPHSVR